MATLSPPTASPNVQVAIETDHETLARLLDKVTEICKSEGGCRCDECSSAMVQICEGSFSELSNKMLCLMMAHFEREDRMMSGLPVTRATQRHCEGHRSAHNELTCQYNHLISERRHANLVDSISDFEAFVVSWTRSHALRYDAELAQLLHRH